MTDEKFTNEKSQMQLKKLNYNSYLKIPELLNLQQPLSKPEHHDEMFFIVIHQATELWFKLLMHETKNLMQAFEQGAVSRALKVLKRNTEIMSLLKEQITLLSTLTPVEFAGFRDELQPASGFQSIQFRQFEFQYGLRDEFFLNFFAKEPEKHQALSKILDQPSVYDLFLRSLKNAGYEIPETVLKRNFRTPYEGNDAVVQTLKEIYSNPKDNYHWVLLCEAMLDFDERLSLWRAHHLQMVARTIGQKRGTGGSSGFEFLKSRLHSRFFPDLWNVRNIIGSDYS